MNKNQLEKLKISIEKCSPEGGNCRNCDKCFVEVCGMCYAFGCRKTEKIFGTISNSTKTLKSELLDALDFEIKVAD